MLKNKTVLLGVTGGIAAYKAAALADGYRLSPAVCLDDVAQQGDLIVAVLVRVFRVRDHFCDGE